MALRDRQALALTYVLHCSLLPSPVLKGLYFWGGVSQLLSPQELSGGGARCNLSIGAYFSGRWSLAPEPVPGVMEEPVCGACT